MSILGLLYGLIVGFPMTLAAWMTERIFAHWRLPRRAIWFLSILGTILTTALLILAAWRGPSESPESQAGDGFLDVFNPAALLSEIHSRVPASAVGWFATFEIVWTAAVALVYASSWLRIWIASKTWRQAIVDDTKVFVSDEHGPAVFGFLSPKIVIPRWMLTSRLDTRLVALAHEQQHIDAFDPALTLVTMILTAFMPWNLFVVYQLQQLRFAIEVDCDARVLRKRGGPTLGVYADALREILRRWHRQNGIPFVPLSTLQLESRIAVLRNAHPMTQAGP
jgi:bla regulator protein BlaR1